MTIEPVIVAAIAAVSGIVSGLVVSLVSHGARTGGTCSVIGVRDETRTLMPSRTT
jgi:hypothetical protein